MIPFLARIVEALCVERRVAEAVSAAVVVEACRGSARGTLDRVGLVRIATAVHARVAKDDRLEGDRGVPNARTRTRSFPRRRPEDPLEAALRALSTTRRLAVHLVDVERFSYPEAAAALEVPIDEFARDLHAARLALMPALGAGPRSHGSRSILRR